MKSDVRLARIERKLDFVMRLQGLTVMEIAQLVEAEDDDAAIAALIDKLKASGDALKAAVAANQP